MELTKKFIKRKQNQSKEEKECGVPTQRILEK